MYIQQNPAVTKALKQIEEFKKRTSHAGRFYSIPRAQVADGLAERVKDPSKINQGAAQLCGPAALLYSVAQDSPEAYTQFGIDLFEKGEGRLKELVVTPGDDLLRAVPKNGSIDMADWVTLASLRDSENWFGFSYSDTNQAAAGITWPNEFEKWFTKIGYTKVINKASKWSTQNRLNAEEASRLYDDDDYHVVLLLNHKLLTQRGHRTYEHSVATPPTHYVVLRSKIQFAPTVKFDVYTWGQRRVQVPHLGEAMTLDEFLGNYFGFVACKH